MKRFFLRLLLFVFPFLLMIGLELFVLPIDFFTFRVWEAVLIREFRSILPGRFYPRMEITKLETGGDLTHHTPFATGREVKWMTDRHGFRKKDSQRIKPQMVIIGDSNIAGCGLTQEEMLPEVLEHELKVSVYPYAPAGLNAFLKDLRFQKDPPRVVVVSVIERDIVNLRFPKPPKKRGVFSSVYEWRDKIRQMRWVQWLGVFLDRLSKMNMLHYVRARIGNRAIREVHYVPSKFGPMFFLQGEVANQAVSNEDFQRAIKTIEAYDQVLRKRGIRFIFLPIPNKENIYHQYLPNPRRPIFLEQLIQELRKRKIEVVDTQKAFDNEFRRNGTLLYFLDDSHWNGMAVRLAGDLTFELIKKKD
jgi:alginate O-acetyltransferase complex protein AlgJ